MNKQITLALTRKSVPTRMDVVQYATAPNIVFILEDYTPGAGAGATLYIEKPDGTLVYNNCTIEGNQVTYTPTTQSFAVVGTSKCQLEITECNGTAVSFLIFANVTENIIDSSAIESENEFSALQEALQTVSEYDGKIETNTNRLDNLGNEKLTFTEATVDTTISDNLTLSTIFGRIKRLFTRTSNVESAITIDDSVITAFKNDGWTPPSGGVISSLFNYLITKLTRNTIATTYVSNSYVSQTSFNRSSCYKAGGVGYLYLNLSIDTTAIPTNTSYFQIGSLNLTPVTGSYYILPPQNGSAGNLYVEIASGGKLFIANYSNAACTGFYRGILTFLIK